MFGGLLGGMFYYWYMCKKHVTHGVDFLEESRGWADAVFFLENLTHSMHV